MNAYLKRFIFKVFSITAALIFIGWLLFSLFIPQYYLPVFPYTLALFAIVSVAIHAFQLKLAKKDMAKFARSTMLITFLKLIFYSIFAIIYIANNSENALPFVIALFFLYLIFSFVEVSELTRISKRKKQ